jgi:hypothetical protein
MAGTTPTYGFRYQTVSDVPNGAIASQNLATDVENKIVTVDASILSHVPTSLEQAATSDTTMSTTPGDVNGASLTFSTTVANTIAVVTVEWDWRLFIAGTGYCYGIINVDGSDLTRKSLFVAQSAETRLQGFMRQRVNLAATGPHTIKLRCQKDGAGGTALFCGDTTVLSIDLYKYA